MVHIIQAFVTLARQVIKELPQKSLVLMDRNFGGWELLSDIQSRGSEFVVRVKSNLKFKVIEHLAKNDDIIEVKVHRALRKKRPDLSDILTVRRVGYLPSGGKEIIWLYLSVLDKKIKAPEWAAMYHQRWCIETIFDEIKTHLCGCAAVNQPVVFRSRTQPRVEQEYYALLIAYNTLRRMMTQAAQTQGVSPLRLNMTTALERIRETCYEMMRAALEKLKYCYEEMQKRIARIRVPLRPGRHGPRSVKIKMSKYPLKRCA